MSHTTSTTAAAETTPPASPNPNAAPAHALWVELATRITTQSLHQRSGDEETAATSVAKLFQSTRELLEKNPAAKEFETLALRLLNVTLRPYTARWDGWMTTDKDARTGEGAVVRKFKDEWYRRQFRRELRELQPLILPYVTALDFLRQGRHPTPWWTTSAAQNAGKPSVNLGVSLEAGIRNQVRFAHSDDQKQEELRKQINAAEHQEIRRKRGCADDAPVTNVKALAFSGGGIRSATFCLGITQVLARRGLLREFDYLSTVSGGGYFGAFLSAYLGSKEAPPKPGTPPAAAAERIGAAFLPAANQREPRPLRHLRNRSRYLVDGRFTGKVIGVGMVLAGVLFNLLILLPVPLFMALWTYWQRAEGWFGALGWVRDGGRWFTAGDAPVSGWLVGALAVLGVLMLAYPWIRAKREQLSAEHWARWLLKCWNLLFLAVLGASVALLVSWLAPMGFRIYHVARNSHFLDQFEVLGAKVEHLSTLLGVSLTAALGLVATKKPGAGRLAWLLPKLAILAGPLLYCFVFFAVCHRLMFAGAWERWDWQNVLWVTCGVAAWGWLWVNVNAYSPHGFYRDRLSNCYLIRPKLPGDRDRGGDDDDVGYADRLKLSKLGESGIAPYHLINTTVNLPSSELREMRGRRGDFFVFSKKFCGSPMCGYYPTTDLERADGHLNLGTAMAISGAAVSSNMGWQSKDSLRVLLTIANVRMGYWLPNPKYAAKYSPLKYWVPGPVCLFREMFASQMDENRLFLNLSDGGHIENLAAYELLRRRCKFIVCVDGGWEPGMECEDLMRLERYAAIDLGIKMHYDLTDLMLQPNGHSRAYGVMVKIDYNPPANEAERRGRKPENAEWGWMLYLKLAMVGYGPGYVMDYKRQNPDFPHETTADQVYDEGQFEAYRALGEAAAESFFTAELAGNGGQPQNVAAWFTSLVSALLPDNDEVFGKA